MAWLASVLDVVFPVRCVGCGAPAAALCPACLAAAGRPAGARPPPGLDWWASAFTYEGAVREALARLKYRNARAALPVLAAALVRRLEAELPGPVDVVTWPPTTAARRQLRAFDQAEHLAGAVGRSLGLPVRPCLVRQAGPSQTGRSAEARRRGPAFGPGLSPVAGLRVLVVDDVATTGATLTAAARVLRASGACWVGGATAARTPRRAGGPEGCGSATARSSGPAGAPTELVMDRIHPATDSRQDVIVRLRQQVAEGVYQPPVDELVNVLVNVVMAGRSAGDTPPTPR